MFHAEVTFELLFLHFKSAGPASKPWLPDGYSQIFRSYVFGPLGLKDYGSATLRSKI